MTDVWGADYGGPATAIVHQDRLVLMGGAAVSDVVAASKTGSWLDFDTGGADATASDGFWFQQTSSRGNGFHAAVQQQGLLIFGDIGEAAVPPGPFTAAETRIAENSWIGSDIGRAPIIAGNLVVFLQKGGQDCRGIVWNEQQLKYIAPSLLQLSGPVFEKARDMTYQPSAGDRGDTVYVVDEDGTMAVLLLRVGEDQPSWSRWETLGRIVGAACPLGRSVFIVERNGAMGLETLTERERDAGAFDCQEVLTGEGMLPEWMEGLQGGDRTGLQDDLVPPLRARFADASGALFECPVSFVVRSGRPVRSDTGEDLWVGREMLGAPNAVRLEVGLRYERILETVQFVRRTQTGNSARMTPQRILECVVDFVLPGDRRLETTTPSAQQRARERLRGRKPETEMERREARERARDFAKACEMTIVTTSRARKHRRRVRHAPPRLEEENANIASVQYPARMGWRDRIAVELWSEDHYEVAGVAYRASA